MTLILKEIASYLGREVEGDLLHPVTGFNDLEHAVEGDISFLVGANYLDRAAACKASALLIPSNLTKLQMAMVTGRSLILSANPYVDYARMVARFFDRPPDPASAYLQSAGIGNKTLSSIGCIPETTVFQGAFIHQTASIHPEAQIYPGAVIGPRAVIGPGTRIYPNVTILDDSAVGADSILYPGVCVRERVRLGDRVVVQPGAVIGSDGFGFAWDTGAGVKIPQIGGVIIGDDVEIGAGVTIDRGAIQDTVIGSGTKIDNLVHIAHNCRIGRNCIIVAQVGISGSVTVGDNCTFAGQTGTVGHVTIGAGTTVAARGVVTADLPPGSTVSGFPAKPHFEEKRIMAAMRKLPEVVRFVQKLMRGNRPNPEDRETGADSGTNAGHGPDTGADAGTGIATGRESLREQ